MCVDQEDFDEMIARQFEETVAASRAADGGTNEEKLRALNNDLNNNNNSPSNDDANEKPRRNGLDTSKDDANINRRRNGNSAEDKFADESFIEVCADCVKSRLCSSDETEKRPRRPGGDVRRLEKAFRESRNKPAKREAMDRENGRQVDEGNDDDCVTDDDDDDYDGDNDDDNLSGATPDSTRVNGFITHSNPLLASTFNGPIDRHSLDEKDEVGIDEPEDELPKLPSSLDDDASWFTRSALNAGKRRLK